MICRHCGTEINTLVREADGSVVCSGCGAVYRPKIAQLTETESKIHGSVQKEKKNDRHTERSTSHSSSLIRNVLVAAFLIIVAFLGATAIIIAKPYLNNSYKIGDEIVFGTYEQDNNLSNGREPIEWIIAEKSKDSILVVSKYSIDRQQFSPDRNYTTWDRSMLRSWLNHSFLSEAFSVEEQQSIVTTTVAADKPHDNSDPGKDTRDKVFLLSLEEYEKLDKKAGLGFGRPTLYADSANKSYNSEQGHWWLRTPAQNNSTVVTIMWGITTYDGDYPDAYLDVRPAMWINVN